MAHAHPGKAIYLDLELPADLAKLAEAELYLEAHTEVPIAGDLPQGS
ncbi:MAG: hypothetical protein HYW07_11450 [Candidatus Latescibacteria bacterium]|nr:hypothetical protein [Candidatus Latescibacterota bacterium]